MGDRASFEARSNEARESSRDSVKPPPPAEVGCKRVRDILEWLRAVLVYLLLLSFDHRSKG